MLNPRYVKTPDLVEGDRGETISKSNESRFTLAPLPAWAQEPTYKLDAYLPSSPEEIHQRQRAAAWRKRTKDATRRASHGLTPLVVEMYPPRPPQPSTYLMSDAQRVEYARALMNDPRVPWSAWECRARLVAPAQAVAA